MRETTSSFSTIKAENTPNPMRHGGRQRFPAKLCRVPKGRSCCLSQFYDSVLSPVEHLETFQKYDDLVDMFNLPTPVSPLPSTLEVSPSYAPSQYGISPIEKSVTLLEYSPLRDPPKIIAPVKKVDSTIQRRPRSRDRWL
ncbi:hypothetical protein TNCV_3648851 [Trichonephila clavipes]|nr:hypothetical protein TNCV_3648851 [Trichonephila clavipes]